ncbi:MAG: hypothetical protein FWB83_07070 [Treponema sp.]|nr:hypothetical protein [Treponema sp.]
MSANEKIGYQYTAKNVILSILVGIIFIAGAVLAFGLLFIPQRMVLRGSQYPPSVPEIAVSVFGVIGVIMIIAAAAGAIKSYMMKSTNDGTGTYLKHTKHRGFEGKNGRDRGRYDYWLVYYSYTDEEGKCRESKFFCDNLSNVLALKHIGAFPIKYRGRRSELNVDKESLNQCKQFIDESARVEKDELTAEDKAMLKAEDFVMTQWYLRIPLKIFSAIAPYMKSFNSRRVKK